MKRILATGFESFGRREANSSEIAVRELQGMNNVETLILPVEFKRAPSMVLDKVRDGQYDSIMSFGEKPGIRSAVHFEERAHNRAFALTIPDNAGVRVAGKLQRDAPVAQLWSTLDYTDLEEALDEAGLRSRRSRKAGKFVCNATLFGLLEAQRRGYIESHVSIGFAHLAHMSSNDACRAVGVVVETLRERD